MGSPGLLAVPGADPAGCAVTAWGGEVRGQLPGVFIATGTCFIHKGIFEFNPDTVVMVSVDPATGRPPDVGADGQPCVPDPEATARAVQEPMCDQCIRELNTTRAARFPGLAPLPVAGDQ
jgi:hypothetical protein